MTPPRHRSSTDDIFTEPQRLHKVLASCGFGSRRAMEEMILAGRITVNREPADVGQKVGPGDEVRINGELVKVRFAEPRTRILMYHKPAGEIVTRDDPEGRPTVFEKLPSIGNGKWIAIGRLDFNTEGLLLFTNSGELANKMMHPRYEVEREYAVRIVGLLTPEQQQSLLTGIELEDGPGKLEKLEDGGGEGSNHWYHIVLKEGRNREVRRLFEALGLTVSRLIRTRYGTVAMPSRVKRGQTLELTPEEVGAVLTAAGMRPAGPAPRKQGRRTTPGAGRAPGRQWSATLRSRAARPRTARTATRIRADCRPRRRCRAASRVRGHRAGQQRERASHARQHARRQVLRQEPRQAARTPARSRRCPPRRAGARCGGPQLRAARSTAARHAAPRRAARGTWPGVAVRGDDADRAGRGSGRPAGYRQPQAEGAGRRQGSSRRHGSGQRRARSGRRAEEAGTRQSQPATNERRDERRQARRRAQPVPRPSTTTSAIASNADRSRARCRKTWRRARSAPIDDDIGNRVVRDRKPDAPARNDAVRAVDPAGIDDDFGNR